jgi:outer membrane lipoprotein SlyB
MSTTPQTPAQDLSNPTRPFAGVHRAVWVGGGLLSLVTAGVAGALIMRAAEPGAVATASPTALSAAPAAPGATAEPDSPAPAPQAAAKKAPAVQARTGAAPTLQGRTTPAALCASCGTVESVTVVRQKGEGTGIGAVAGGVLGGVVGHQIGGGDGKKAMTVIGAVGGGLAGNEIEKRARSSTVFNVHVRMQDGTRKVFQRAESMAVGTRVVVDGTALRIVREGSTKGDQPQFVRTGAPAAGRT